MDINNLKDDFEKLEIKIEILKDALSLYADMDNWVMAKYKYHTTSNDSLFNAYDNGDEEGTEDCYFGGAIARKALRDIEKL